VERIEAPEVFRAENEHRAGAECYAVLPRNAAGLSSQANEHLSEEKE
jgi:hypothetical protein